MAAGHTVCVGAVDVENAQVIDLVTAGDRLAVAFYRAFRALGEFFVLSPVDLEKESPGLGRFSVVASLAGRNSGGRGDVGVAGAVDIDARPRCDEALRRVEHGIIYLSVLRDAVGERRIKQNVHARPGRHPVEHKLQNIRIKGSYVTVILADEGCEHARRVAFGRMYRPSELNHSSDDLVEKSAHDLAVSVPVVTGHKRTHKRRRRASAEHAGAFAEQHRCSVSRRLDRGADAGRTSAQNDHVKFPVQRQIFRVTNGVVHLSSSQLSFTSI